MGIRGRADPASGFPLIGDEVGRRVHVRKEVLVELEDVDAQVLERAVEREVAVGDAPLEDGQR